MTRAMASLTGPSATVTVAPHRRAMSSPNGRRVIAMTRAPVAAVAALRETSVLFAALIGALWLKEGLGPMRLAGAASVVAGVAALRL